MRATNIGKFLPRVLVPILCTLAFLAAPLASAANYPSRPITLIVPWAAGGGTDATARIIAHGLQEVLGMPVNVVNRTGGSGVVGHTAIANAEPNGYTIGMATVELNMMHWQGLTDLTYKDYTPIAQVNFDPAGLNVRADSKWGNVQDMLTSIKKQPAGTYKGSGTGQGGIWQVALAGLLLDQDLNPNAVTWVPSQGAAPGLRDLIAGGVAIAPVSLPEARTLIEAGKVKALAVMAEERNEAFPDVPTLKEAIGTDYTLGAWRGIVAPKGLPEDISGKLEAALKKVYNSDDFKAFMNSRGYGMKWRGSEAFKSYLENNNQLMGEIMRAVGLAAE